MVLSVRFELALHLSRLASRVPQVARSKSDLNRIPVSEGQFKTEPHNASLENEKFVKLYLQYELTFT